MAPYVGDFGSATPTRRPLLIKPCQRVRREIPELRLLLAGPVEVADLDKPGIIYHGVLSQESIPERIAACNVVAVPYSDDTFSRLSGACEIG